MAGDEVKWSHRPTIVDYAARLGCEPADLADMIAEGFFDHRLDTLAIAQSLGLPEGAVYNFVHAWREHGRAP